MFFRCFAMSRTVFRLGRRSQSSPGWIGSSDGTENCVATVQCAKRLHHVAFGRADQCVSVAGDGVEGRCGLVDVDGSIIMWLKQETISYKSP
jgi:hypothetical protein